MFDSIHVEASGGVAAPKTIQHFPCFGDFTRLVIKNTERGIASGPLRQQVHGALEVLRGLRGLPLQGGDDSQTPQDFSGTGNPRQPLAQRFFGAGDVIFAELDESEREVILVVVRIALNGFTENFLSAGRVAQMRMDISEQRQESVILLT